MRRSAAAGVALAFAALALGACGSTDQKTAKGAHRVEVKLTERGCSPAKLSLASGATTFVVSNAGTRDVTEFEVKNSKGEILGERENVVERISGSFTITLQPGTYVLACPGGKGADTGTLVVRGKRQSTTGNDAALTKAVATYRSYIEQQTAALVGVTEKFGAALDRNDLAAARAQFALTRYPYETIEPVAESFGDLDPSIDARVNDVEDPARWTGFHRIERALFVDRTTKGTQGYGRRLLKDVRSLQTRVRTIKLEPTQIANGAVELLNEVAKSKISGEEDRYSHTDLSDIDANLQGAKTAFEALRPALVARGQGALVATIQERFDAVGTVLDRYQLAGDPSGWASYSELTKADRRALAAEVDALAEPLSTVAGKLTG